MKKVGLLILVFSFAALLTWANWSASHLPDGAKADHVVVEKSRRTLTLFVGAQPLKQYTVSLGRNPVGPKEKEGDMKTPEGIYCIVAHKNDSAFHRALRISYPEARDLARAQATGTNPGSDIMIHGIRNGLGPIGRLHRTVDWTAGCIAITNSEMARFLPPSSMARSSKSVRRRGLHASGCCE